MAAQIDSDSIVAQSDDVSDQVLRIYENYEGGNLDALSMLLKFTVLTLNVVVEDSV